MTEGGFTGFNYQFKAVIDLLWPIWWALYMSGDADEGLELWKRNYEVFEIELEGVAVYVSASTLLNQYRAFRDEIGYQPGDRCPCQFRDGWQPPVPMCP